MSAQLSPAGCAASQVPAAGFPNSWITDGGDNAEDDELSPPLEPPVLVTAQVVPLETVRTFTPFETVAGVGPKVIWMSVKDPPPDTDHNHNEFEGPPLIGPLRVPVLVMTTAEDDDTRDLLTHMSVQVEKFPVIRMMSPEAPVMGAPVVVAEQFASVTVMVAACAVEGRAIPRATTRQAGKPSELLCSFTTPPNRPKFHRAAGIPALPTTVQKITVGVRGAQRVWPGERSGRERGRVTPDITCGRFWTGGVCSDRHGNPGDETSA